MTRVLWVGDAGSTTGFSRVTHAIAERLVTDYGHDVSVIAVGFDGRQPYNGPLKLFGAAGPRPDQMTGFDRMRELLELLEPQVVITLEDPPAVVARLGRNPRDGGGGVKWIPGLFATGPWRRISYLPVDGVGFPPEWRRLPQYVEQVAMTKFGALQLGTDNVVYHGVDEDIFYPVSRSQPIEVEGRELRSKSDCRDYFSIPDDAFVIGRIDTNSSRKDWGSTWRAIEWAWPDLPRPAMGMFHTKLRNSSGGMNLEALLARGKATFRVTENRYSSAQLAAYINCWDVAISTSRGEGFGLGSAEALACAVPVLGPKHSAFPEVVGPGGVLVEPATVHTSSYGHDQWVVDWKAMAEALVALGRDEKQRKSLGMAGLEHIRSIASWDRAARQFDDLIEARSERLTDAGQERRDHPVQV